MSQLSSQIQVISFDLDDTLWNGTEVILKAEKAMMAFMQTHTPQVLSTLNVDQLRQKKMQFMKANPQLKYQVSGARRAFLLNLFTEFNYPHAEQLAQDCFQTFYQARQQVTFFDNVIPTLNQLKDDYRLIAITNGNADVQLAGLGGYFELALNSEDFAAPKPDAQIFEHALHHLKVSAEEVLHVGDHPVHDMLGANNVGMKTCWLKDGSRQWPHDFKADLVITHVQELLEHLS